MREPDRERAAEHDRDFDRGAERRRPSRWVVSLLLALAGIGVAGYLTYVHYHLSALVCSFGGCETVQTSRYAVVAGVPVALLGLLMYLAVLALVLLRDRRPDAALSLTVAAFAIVLAGLVFAIYLTYLELAVIHAVCQWCVLSALVTVGLVISEGYGLLREL